MFICEIWEISKFHKSEFGKFIPNFPLKHVITCTNHQKTCFLMISRKTEVREIWRQFLTNTSIANTQ